MADAKRFILHSSEIAQREQPFSHPWNPKSQLMGVQLSRILGLTRTAVSIARIPPGRESFIYHSHHHEEEWHYILSGRGIAEIDGEELVYLMGGENREIEVADFPRLGKRMVRSGEKIEVYDASHAKPFGALDT
jgi:uncharacterized cupin superfamily protein